MMRGTTCSYSLATTALLLLAACSRPGALVSASRSEPGDVRTGDRVERRDARSEAQGVTAQILRGRALVIEHACSGCHSSNAAFDPAMPGYLAGVQSPTAAFTIAGFKTLPRNLTPDNETGLGRFTERQIFNALRFGLRPGETPDVEITSTTPGQGNFPARPKYMAPPMPWPDWRHMTDQELLDIAAYLKRAVKPVRNKVADSEGPPDFWASAYKERIGPYPSVPFPSVNEVGTPTGSDQLVRGRLLVIHHACGDCHGGVDNPAADGWMVGARTPADTFIVGPFITRARNLTPDNETGLGRFTERQIFNALRFGLRPGETPDVEITSTTPGEGNFPARPKYLAAPMPWPAWRHMTDQQLRDIAAYLKRGLKPVRNKVADSEGPPDFWASEYTPAKIGPYPASPFPTANEKAP
jgi:mono/diheme cytochrome c family protein